MSDLLGFSSRRDFIRGMGVTAATVSTPLRAVQSARPARIKSLKLRGDTLLRLGGQGSPCGSTWSADDQILVGIGEGTSWAGIAPGLYFGSALMSIKGEPTTALIEAVRGYPVQPVQEYYHIPGGTQYYPLSTLAIGDSIYQFLGTTHGHMVPKGGYFTIDGTHGCKVIYSPDNGRTWYNQSGSTPVRRETENEQSNKTMLFWDEPGDLFASPILVQMGKAYADNQDGYVYGYSGKKSSELHGHNDLMLFRVDKQQILNRAAYQFFSSRRANGAASWVQDIGASAAVHTLPSGWGCSSVVYFKSLDLYIMAASKWRPLDDLGPFTWAGPSSLGFWASRKPWGPWTQVYKDDSWGPGNPYGSATRPIIIPKWIRPDGKSFWLTWTDTFHTKGFRMESLQPLAYETDPVKFTRGIDRYRASMPYYRFNLQRVEVELA